MQPKVKSKKKKYKHNREEEGFMLRSSTLTSKVKQIKKKRALVAHVCSGASVVSAHCVEGVMVVAENHLGDGGGEHGAVVIREGYFCLICKKRKSSN